MKLKNAIELHHAITPLMIWGLMVTYNNFNRETWIYLALHGTYSFISLLSDLIIPNDTLEKQIPNKVFIVQLLTLGFYWIIPFLIISNSIFISAPIIALSVMMNIIGTILLFSNKVRENFVSKYEKTSIKEKELNQCRIIINFGEILIYFSFAIFTENWIGFLIVTLFLMEIFLDNNYIFSFLNSSYKNYQANIGLVFIKLNIFQL